MISPFRFTVERIISNARLKHGQINKEAKMFQKVLDNMKRRQTLKNKPFLLEKATLSSAFDNEGESKRTVNLNKIYMEYMSHMISSGDFSTELQEFGFEITKVKLARGLNFLHIYWITRKENIDENALNSVLAKALSNLQTQLGSIRFTSKIPFAVFIRDIRIERELHLEKIFEVADYGKDYVPTYGVKVIKPDFVKSGDELPEMRQNVLGVDHEKIKEKIEDKIRKFKAIDIASPEKEPEERLMVPEKLIKFTRKDFFKFYKRQRILELKMKKKMAKKHTESECHYDFEYEDAEEDNEEEEIFKYLFDDDDDDNYDYKNEYEGELSQEESMK